MGYMCLFQFWFPQGICLGVGRQGHMVVLYLVFKGNSIPPFIMAVSIYTPTNRARTFLFFTSSPAVIIGRLFDDGYSDQCKVISHCSFDLHFSNNEWCWVFFHVFVSHLYVFFGKMSIRSISHFLIGLFVFLVLSCMSCLYIWKLILCQLFHLLLFSPILRVIFSPCL